MQAVPIFMDAILYASQEWLKPSPPKARHSSFFNKDCRRQLKLQRKAHRNMLRKPNQQNVKKFQAEGKSLKTCMHKSWFASEPLPDDPRYACDLDTPNENTRTLEPIPWSEITNTLKSCLNQSAPGQSGIGYAILKWVAKSAPDELGAIIRASIKFGIHHPCWKTFAIVAIPKAKKPSYADPKAWRPIQLLECLGKLVEKIMAC